MRKNEVKLPRLHRMDDGNALLAFEPDEVPPAPRLKRSTAVVKWLEANSIAEREEKLQQSVLYNSLFNEVDLDVPDHGLIKYAIPKLQRFLAIIRTGLSIRDAAEIMGWNPDNISTMVSNNVHNLGACVKAAKSENKFFHVSRMANHDYGHQSSAWLLERMYRDEFGKELKVTPGKTEGDQIVKFGDREIKF